MLDWTVLIWRSDRCDGFAVPKNVTDLINGVISGKGLWKEVDSLEQDAPIGDFVGRVSGHVNDVSGWLDLVN